MALKGISFDAGKRRVGEYKIGPVASAGLFYRLGSTAQFLQLASTAEVNQVLEWDVTATGIEDVDILKGVEVRETKVNELARVIELVPGDLVRTDQLASGSDTGAIDGTLVTGQALSFFNGKARQKQTADSLLARIAGVNNANTFDTDGLIWLEIIALA